MKKIIYLLLILFALVTPVPANDEVNVIPRKMEPFTVINVVNGEIQVEKEQLLSVITRVKAI